VTSEVLRLHDCAGGSGLPDGFLELAPEVYRDDPNWIPEDTARMTVLFGRDNPWFRGGDARAFCVPGRCRAAAFRPRDLVVDGAASAFFGYWETVGDEEANAVVMDAVRSWAAELGASRLFGPIDFSTALSYRMRIAGDVTGPPYIGEPYNPPYYPAQLERLGFRIHQRYISWLLDEPELRSHAAEKQTALDQARERGYRFESLDVSTWVGNSGPLFQLANEVFAINFGFTPFSREQFELSFNASWAASLHPDLSLLGFGPDGDVVGFILTYPHYAPLAVQGAGENRVPTGQLSYERHAPMLAGGGDRTVLMKTGGTSPRYRRLGIANAMVGEFAHRALERGVTTMLGGPMREDNPSRLVFSPSDRMERWYGLYVTEL
jgi:ribosomal protein S18 acetylase RimI-like enzyme